jgi:hypothetical protein
LRSIEASGNNRFAVHYRGADYLLLESRHLGQRQLDAEIAARHHDPVRCLDDFLEVFDARLVFDLGDDRRAPIGFQENFAYAMNIVGGLHERRRQVIYIVVGGEGNFTHDVIPELGADSVNREFRVGQVDALVFL